MKGTLYGIGVGPGEFELLTLQAIRIIKECEVIAIPSKSKLSCRAYHIVKEGYPNIEEKECIFLDCPMTKDHSILEISETANTEKIKESLEKGKKIAFLTLGDPSIYSTFLYIKKRLQKDDYTVEMINGIPSFCAMATKLNLSLCEEEEEVHIIPATYGLSEIFNLQGTKILMKAGNCLLEIKEKVKEKNAYIAMIENCGMKDERIFIGVENIPDKAGYLTTVIIKDFLQNL